MSEAYDIVIIGAGSVGVPTAMAMARAGLSVLTIDRHASPGQENNKKAIGGIRATHSDYGKIKVSQRSIEIFSTWKERYGDEIDWLQNGYSFPAYTESDEKKLKDLLKIQQAYGLNISWIDAEEYQKLVPGINSDGLRGATYSPGDGSASPLLAINAFWKRSLHHGARYAFGETVTGFMREGDRITVVRTDKGTYHCHWLVNAAGNDARSIGMMLGHVLPVFPDSHEGAISEPVKRFFEPMIVDMRPAPDSLNYYFYQNIEGKVVFCITPDPPIYGVDNDATSLFLPQVAARMIELYPRLANLKVRRTWRGQYPMTPDGFPIVGRDDAIGNLIHMTGMCGQGFMLGPGLGELVTRIVTESPNDDDVRILKSFDPDRDFAGEEKFK